MTLYNSSQVRACYFRITEIPDYLTQDFFSRGYNFRVYFFTDANFVMFSVACFSVKFEYISLNYWN